MKNKTITRRKLIKDSVITAIGASIFLNSPFKVFAQQKKEFLKKVVLIRDKDVFNNEMINSSVLEKMLDTALVKLTGTNSSIMSWSSILKPNDVLGIKTNAWKSLRTPVELENIITDKAKNIGIKFENISVDDRRVLNNPVFQKSTSLINVRPMRTHAWAGVGSLLKNYIMFADRPSDYHNDSCADLAKLWELPNVKGKTRLNILVMLTPLFHGIGPHHFNKQYTWKYNGLILGFDPVAVDSVGLRIIQAKRNEFFKEDMPLNPPAKHIMLADTRHNLGTADPEKIELIKLGWEEQILI